MNNNTAKEQAAINQFSPEDFLKQDELLKKIEREYFTSAAAPDTTAIDPDQFIEGITFTPLSILESANNSDAEEEDSEEKLHFRNRAQAKHTVDAEKSAIAYWVAGANS